MVDGKGDVSVFPTGKTLDYAIEVLALAVLESMSRNPQKEEDNES
jgi:hypothetical protein